MRRFFFFFLFFLILISCKQKQSLSDKQKEIETGKLDSNNHYEAQEIGWSVDIPAGWAVLTRQQLKSLNSKGKELLEKSMEAEIDDSQLQQLISLKKDPFNSFISTIEKFGEDENGSYETNNQNVYAVLKKAYAEKGINAKYQEGVDTIDGLKFYTFRTRIYDKDSAKLILSQMMYSRLINGYDFGMTATYNNAADMNTLRSMVRSSSFSIRN